MGFDLVIRGATVVTPGHREPADIGIAGDVDTVCSDHAPWTLEAELDPAPAP